MDPASPPPNGPPLALAAGVPKNDDVEVATGIPDTPNAVELAVVVGALLLNGDAGAVVTGGVCCCGVVLPNNDGDDVVGVPNTDVPGGLWAAAVGELKTFVPGTDLND